MRCFIAIDMPKEVREDIARIQDELPSARMKKVDAGKAHMTLKFLGELDRKEIGDVEEGIRKIKANSFKVKTREIGVFRPEFIKVVWLGIESEGGKLKELNSRIEESVENIVSKDERDFKPHVSLARVKNLKGMDRKEFLDKIKKIENKTHTFEVKRIKLKKSELRRTGPEYEDIFVKDLD